MKISDKQTQLLEAKLDRANVRTREQAGQTLSYVDGHYVISRLNEVFGHTAWSTRVVELTVCHSGVNEKGNATVSYLARVELTVHSGDMFNQTEDVGFGHGSDKRPGVAHESAAKEAVTDALKRCARQLGPSFGLALYDKEQKDVEDNEPKIEHGNRAGERLSKFTSAQLAAYDAKYAPEFSEGHREAVRLEIAKGR